MKKIVLNGLLVAVSLSAAVLLMVAADCTVGAIRAGTPKEMAFHSRPTRTPPE